MGRHKKPRVINCLEDICPGDSVYYTDRFQRKVLTVTRVTPTMIVCNTLKFRRNTGVAIPLESFNLSKIQVLTKELEEAHKTNMRKRNLKATIISTNWESLSVDTLEQVLSCIRNDNSESI